MEIDQKNLININEINSKEYNYYLPSSQSMNIMNTLSISQSLKNLEPQDNLKKAAQRKLLEIENKVQNSKNQINEENLIKINNDDYFQYDIKSYTAKKRNNTNRIYQKKFSDNINEAPKLLFFGKFKDDNNILFNHDNNLTNHLIYEKKNRNNYKTIKSMNLEQKLLNEETIEKEPLDNLKKRKTDKNNEIDINTQEKIDNLVYKEINDENKQEKIYSSIEEKNNEKQINDKNDYNNLKENKEALEINKSKDNNKNENENNLITREDNIVYKSIKNLKIQEDNNEENCDNINMSNNKIAYIKETKNIEENEKEMDNDLENKNMIIFNKNNNCHNKEKVKENDINNKQNEDEENVQEEEKKEERTIKNILELENSIKLEEENKENINTIDRNIELELKDKKEENGLISRDTNKERNLNKNNDNERASDGKRDETIVINKDIEKISKNSKEPEELNKIAIDINLKKEDKKEENNKINLNQETNINSNIDNLDIIKNKNKIEIGSQIMEITKINKTNILISKDSQTTNKINLKDEIINKNSKLNKKYSKKNISKVSILLFDTEKQKNIKKGKSLERCFSSKVLTTFGKEVRNISNILEEKEITNNLYEIKENKLRNKYQNKILYKSPKNIIKDNNPINQTHSRRNKNEHKLINRIRSINISTKSLNFNNSTHFKNKMSINNYNLNIKNKQEKNQRKTYDKLNSFSPIHISTQQHNNKRYLSKRYSENNLNQRLNKIFNEGEQNIQTDLDEFKDDGKIYYFEPQSIVNYSSYNLSNKIINKKYQSQSVKKEKKTESRFNNLLNNTLNTLNKNLFKFIDFNFSNSKEKVKVENKKYEIKEIDINKIKENIEMKNRDIEKIKIMIEKVQREIQKYDNEIKSIDSWIEKEEIENKNLIHFLNFYNMNNNLY